MKALIVSISDIEGGAARAAFRLHKALLAENVDSRMLVQGKSCDDIRVVSELNKVKKSLNKLRPFLDSILIRFYKNRNQALFSPAYLPFSDIVKKINDLKPDIVHLHWICNGMLRIEDLVKIKAPIVWSLHDMWAFTGGCHYTEGCERYQSGCGNCKILGSNKVNDLSSRVFNRKQKTYLKLPYLTIVGLSRWMAKSAKGSSLLKNKKIINLPNPIDTNTFKPCDRDEVRKLWNLPLDKKMILFGAMGATSDPRKGFQELLRALSGIENNSNIELAVFGSSEPKNPPKFSFKTHYLGQLSDDVSLCSLYNAVDVVVLPSLQENLSNTIMESLSCATPVVAFDIGGNGDMIEHQKNGYLAKLFDTFDLAYGIEWVLDNLEYEKLCKNAREKVLREFDSKIVAKKYIELYQSILDDRL